MVDKKPLNLKKKILEENHMVWKMLRLKISQPKKRLGKENSGR